MNLVNSIVSESAGRKVRYDMFHNSLLKLNVANDLVFADVMRDTSNKIYYSMFDFTIEDRCRYLNLP